MSSLTASINTLIGVGTLLSHVILVAGILLLFIEKRVRVAVYAFVQRYILELLAVSSLFAFLGSLVYSQLIGFPPCELCWVQRICMYPQALLAFMAVIKKDKKIVDYLLPLSIIGAVVSLYHSFVQWGFNSSLLGCTAQVGGECAKVYVKVYGYITIPFMSFTVFAYLIALTLIYYKSRKALNS